MAPIVYVLSALTCLGCAVLLIKGYARSKTRILMWLALCFIGLTVNNVMLVIDYSVGPVMDLSIPRLLIGFASIAVLAGGLAWDVR